MNTEIKTLLENVRNGSVSVDEALLRLKEQPFQDVGYAKIDHHRSIRRHHHRRSTHDLRHDDVLRHGDHS